MGTLDGSVGEDACHQVLKLEIDPLDSYSQESEATPERCPLTSPHPCIHYGSCHPQTLHSRPPTAGIKKMNKVMQFKQLKPPQISRCYFFVVILTMPFFGLLLRDRVSPQFRQDSNFLHSQVILNSWSSCLHVPSAGLIVLHLISLRVSHEIISPFATCLVLVHVVKFHYSIKLTQSSLFIW